MTQRNDELDTQFVVFDFDGTLIENPTKMEEYVEAGVFSWELFMKDSLNRKVIEPVYDRMQEYQSMGYNCIIVTARPECEELEQYMIRELMARSLGEDMLVQRCMELFDAEQADLDYTLAGMADVADDEQLYEAQRTVVHKHHAFYRKAVIEDLENLYGKGCIHAAFDDQSQNLNVFKEHGIKTFLVANSNFTTY